MGKNSVAVCVCTYLRPKSLERTLRSLGALRFKSPERKPELRVVVVDNDPKASARALVESLRAELPFAITYEVEPRQGIPFARNTSLRASEPSELIAFIDDDETPAPDWLELLLEALEVHVADVATGPVVPVLAQPVPRWIERGEFFRATERPTGTIVGEAFTNNVLFKRSVLSRMEGAFDERMARTGGSDTHFFRRVAVSGGKIVWCAEAVVYDHVPASRMSEKWLLQRSYRVGGVMTFVRMETEPLPKALLLTSVATARAAIVGGALVAAGVVAGKHLRVRGERWLAYGAGLVAGVRGVHYEEYKEIHGS
ncbi:MAG TPA: glycosyltransferase family 2 protein [Polyangiales bacterium]|jgi:glycosyltransferase involved in cell wall biosynthesis|nr:glycosyltransferase family 2 protein [Polyangiales bacterium]